MRTFVARLAVLLVAAAPISIDAQTTEQTLYVSVLDADGRPVTGLSVGDFVVKEDGVTREVLRAGRTADPLDLAIIVDNSQAIQPYQNDLRMALTSFVTKMTEQQSTSIALLGMADRPTILTDYTTSGAELARGVTKIFAQPGSGTVFQDTIVDTIKGLKKHDSPRRAIVVITTEETDFSNVPYERTLESLAQSGAALHVLVLTSRDGASLRDVHARDRNIVIDQGTRDTGGRRDNLLSSMALNDALSRVAEDLSQQYKVVYGRPGALMPPKRVQTSVKKEGLKARATLVRSTSGA
jgi:VWFA-related protein